MTNNDDEILKHFQMRFSQLPRGTVLVPPTDDVRFNDSKLMPKQPCHTAEYWWTEHGWDLRENDWELAEAESYIEDAEHERAAFAAEWQNSACLKCGTFYEEAISDTCSSCGAER